MAFRNICHIAAALLLLLSLATGAAATVQVRVVPSAGAIGSTVTVAVEADSVADLGGFQLAFSFSTPDLQVISATINPAFDQVVFQDLGGSTGNGMLAAAVYDNSPVTGGPVTLASIDFKVLTPVTSGINLPKVILGQLGGAEIPAAVVDGNVAGTGIDVTPPTDGTLTAAPGTSGEVNLAWTAATDAGGTVASYTLCYATGGFPADCNSGTRLYQGPLTGYVHTGLPYGTLSYYRVCATDAAGNTSAGATASALTITPNFSVRFFSGGNGTVSGPTTQSVPLNGSAAAVTAMPDPGYHFVDWTGTGFVTSTANPLTVTNVTYDLAITANFALDADVTLPTISYFMLPPTAASLTVPVYTLIAYDNVGVTGYLLSELSIQPSPTDPGWMPSPPSSYTFATQGARTLYAFARDAAGNISGGYPATVIITLPDTTPPVIDSFSLPATSQSLTVPVTSLTASDDTAVTGYLLSESPAQPLPTDAGWSPSPPSEYTFASPGARDLYAFAKDAAGNVSAASHASVTITLPDTTPPVVTSFSLPPAAQSLTVAVLTLSASDDVAVTGYLLSEMPTQPLLSDPSWTQVPAVSHTFASQGTRTLYAFARDAAGNISAAVPAQVTITLPDVTPPVVTSFALPTTSGSLTVGILSFTANDDVATSGYLLSESPDPPLPGDPRWTSTPSGSYTFATAGLKTLYAFAEDAAGNVSLPASAMVAITLADTQPPLIQSFSLPATASSRTVAITVFTAWDDTGIAAYLLSESAAQPSLSDPAWTPTPPGSYTFATPGAKTLYAFARDAAGNVSGPAAATVTITLPDVTAPTIGTFSIPAASSTLTVPVISFTASDDTGVAGYLLSESPAVPSPADPDWTLTPSRSYTFAAPGTKTLYAFVRDAAGNISVPVSATVAITIDSGNYIIRATAGADGSIAPAGEVPVNAGVSQTFTFSPVAGYHVADVIVDGTSVGQLPSFTFTNVRTAHTIEVKFAPPDGILDPTNTSGAVTISDAVIIMGIAMGDVVPTSAQLAHGDVAPLKNGKSSPDGRIDLGDVVVILRKLVGLI